MKRCTLPCPAWPTAASAGRPPGPCAARAPLARAALLTLVVVLLGRAWAQPVLPTAVIERATALAGQAAQNLAPPQARIVVQAGPLDSRLKLAPCDDIQVYLPAGLNPWGRSRMGLRCLSGRARWNVMLPVTVQAWAPAVVLAAPLPAGASLQALQLAHREVDWATVAPGSFFVRQEELADRVLTRPLAAGQPVADADLKPRQWFSIGDPVQLQTLGRGFSIVSEVQALTPGLEGRPARVRTPTGRVLQAMPVGQGRARLVL